MCNLFQSAAVVTFIAASIHCIDIPNEWWVSAQTVAQLLGGVMLMLLSFWSTSGCYQVHLVTASELSNF